MFNFPHGFYVDDEGNVRVSDERAKNRKGAAAVKFSPQGQAVLTLGSPEWRSGSSSVGRATLRSTSMT
jgi:hypothetical protein